MSYTLLESGVEEGWRQERIQGGGLSPPPKSGGSQKCIRGNTKRRTYKVLGGRFVDSVYAI